MPQDKDNKRATDLDLWRVSVSGVKPLKARKREVAVKASNPTTSALKKAAKPPAKTPTNTPAKKTWTKLEPSPHTSPRSSSPPSSPSSPLSSHSFATPDRKTKRALSKGKKTVEATLDLHGFTQEKAHAALRRFLLNAHTNNQRLVRVITGKGKREGEGVLRQKLLHWLEADKALALLILALEEAALHHGGAGAFNIWLRKK